MKQSIFFILGLFIPKILIAQTDSLQTISTFWDNNFVTASYQNGYVIPTNDFVRGSNTEKEQIKAFQTFSVKLSKQSYGKKSWEQLYNYPEWGVGISVYDFYNPEEIGNPIAVYGFLNAPFIRRERFTFNYELGFGATFNWKHFDPIKNSSNTAIGAGESFYIDAGLNIQYVLTKHLNVETGFSLSHFSNGALKKPNLGLNTIAPKISIKYNLDEQPEFIPQKIPEFHPHKEWLVSAFFAGTNVVFDSVNVDVQEKFEGITFTVAGITTTFNQHFRRKSKVGIGVAFTYNGSINAQVAADHNELEVTKGMFIDKIQVSIFPSYEFVVNRFSLLLQPAFYLYRKEIAHQTPVFHQRIGVKYHISDDFFTGITLRDYDFHVSDFVEWTIGYRFKVGSIN